MDVELVIGFAMAFCLGLVFLVLARGSGKVVDKAFLYTASGVLFFIITPLFAVMEQTYIFIGLIFLIPAVYAFGFAGISFFQVYKRSSMEDWEKSEEDSEP